MKKNNLIGSSIIIGTGLIIQLIIYYGSYLEKQDWNLVLNEAFSDIGFAIGYHWVLIVCIIFTVVKIRKHKDKQ